MLGAPRILPFVFLLLCLGALVLPRALAPELQSAHAVKELLLLPLDTSREAADTLAVQPLWRALLESAAATRTESGTTLALGQVLADPSAARLAAETAGELLRLPARSATGELGKPLWQVLLDGPATERTEAGRTVKLGGCRHRADAAAAPTLEDTYAARLSLAHELEALAEEEPSYGPLVIQGAETPVKGGAHFDVGLIGDTQSVELTFDGAPRERFTAERSLRFSAPNDEEARQSLVRGLQELAATDAAVGSLTIEGAEAPVSGGIDVRLESFGSQQGLCAWCGKAPPLSVHRDLVVASTLGDGRTLLGGAAAVTALLWSVLRARARPAAPKSAALTVQLSNEKP